MGGRARLGPEFWFAECLHTQAIFIYCLVPTLLWRELCTHVNMKKLRLRESPPKVTQQGMKQLGEAREGDLIS